MVVYEILGTDGKPSMLVLPIEGYGLWSTLYGFLALDVDLETIRGLSFYQHGETAGSGRRSRQPELEGALARPQSLWRASGTVAIEVIKGPAGPPDANPYKVDGLSGATLTSNGVTHMLQLLAGRIGLRTVFPEVSGIGKLLTGRLDTDG